MTDINYTPEVDPIEDGQVTEEVVEASPEESQSFDWNEYADRKVRLPVAGEEIEVPLSEALAGYQRQSDYTRKTQELAQQRQEVQFASAIQQALDNDPMGTIQLLQEHYGLNEQQEFDEFADPLEQQYRTLDTRIRAFEEAQAMQELENTISSLQSRYGNDFDANEVVAKALASGASDLEAVYKQMAFDRVYESRRAETDFAARKAAGEQAAIQAKREAGIISGGTSARGATVGTGQITSLREAFAAAQQQLGIS